MKITLFLLLLINSCTLMAQDSLLVIAADEDRNKFIAGKYGTNEGICLFEDGRYLVYNGNTATIFGNYAFEKDYILFNPDRVDRFILYASENPNMGKRTRLDFNGFDDYDYIFVQFNKEKPRAVFNKNASCLTGGPFVYEFSGSLSEMTWVDVQKSENNKGLYEALTFKNDSKFNDFIVVYNKPNKERKPFSGRLYKNNQGQVYIQLSHSGSKKSYTKEAEEDKSNWAEILEIKQVYEKNKNSITQEIYANMHYMPFNKPDSQYFYDEKNKVYHKKREERENDVDFADNPLSDDRQLRAYKKVILQQTSLSKFDEKQAFLNPVFYTECYHEAKSYRYLPLDKQRKKDIEKLELFNPPKAVYPEDRSPVKK